MSNELNGNEKKTILVVEDEESLQLAIKTKLKASPYKYVSARTAEEAIELLNGGLKPDLIWLDLLMPGMGGLAFLEKIRTNKEWSALPVVIVSVSAGAEKIRHAFELNVVDYIVKSQYRLEDIISKINGFIS